MKLEVLHSIHNVHKFNSSYSIIKSTIIIKPTDRRAIVNLGEVGVGSSNHHGSYKESKMFYMRH